MGESCQEVELHHGDLECSAESWWGTFSNQAGTSLDLYLKAAAARTLRYTYSLLNAPILKSPKGCALWYPFV